MLQLKTPYLIQTMFDIHVSISLSLSYLKRKRHAMICMGVEEFIPRHIEDYDFIKETVTKLTPNQRVLQFLVSSWVAVCRSWVQNLSNFKYTNNVVIFLEMDTLRRTYFQTLLSHPLIIQKVYK